LTGIVLKNGKKQAILQDKKDATRFLHKNNKFDDIIFIFIYGTNGEKTVAYHVKFSITFRMNRISARVSMKTRIVASFIALPECQNNNVH
jgi:hypothetical protein